MVPLALRPTRPLHVDFNQYYADISHGDQLRRFSDKDAWRDAIFAHLEDDPELLMVRLWQCVEANHEGRIAPSVEDLVWRLWFNVVAWAILILICLVLILLLCRFG